METVLRSLLVLSVINFTLEYEECSQNRTELDEFDSRSKLHRIRKRSLVFPKGSAFVVTPSILKAIPVQGLNWNQAHEFDIVWPIPNEEDKSKLQSKSKLKLKLKYPTRKNYFRRPSWKTHRHRRELYSNFESALERFNLPGKTCILRTICEAKTLLNPPGVSLIEDILRVILSNPIISKKSTDEYDLAHETKKDCDLMYPCPFSLLNFLLNYNSYHFH